LISVIVLTICVSFTNNLMGQILIPEGRIEDPQAFTQKALNRSTQTHSEGDIIVYETSLHSSYLGILEANIFADDIWLANPGETVITKIKAGFTIINREESQQITLWIFEDLNQAAIHSQVIVESDWVTGYVLAGLTEPVSVPQHFYIGFSIQGDDSTDPIAISQEVLTGQGTEATYLYGTVEGGRPMGKAVYDIGKMR